MHLFLLDVIGTHFGSHRCDKKLLGTKGIATRTYWAPGLTTRNKKLLGSRVSTSFLFLVVRHLLLVAMHLFLLDVIGTHFGSHRCDKKLLGTKGIATRTY